MQKIKSEDVLRRTAAGAKTTGCAQRRYNRKNRGLCAYLLKTPSTATALKESSRLQVKVQHINHRTSGRLRTLEPRKAALDKAVRAYVAADAMHQPQQVPRFWLVSSVEGDPRNSQQWPVPRYVHHDAMFTGDNENVQEDCQATLQRAKAAFTAACTLVSVRCVGGGACRESVRWSRRRCRGRRLVRFGGALRQLWSGLCQRAVCLPFGSAAVDRVVAAVVTGCFCQGAGNFCWPSSAVVTALRQRWLPGGRG